MVMSKPQGIQLALPCTRVGRMGMLDLGHDYMAGVRNRAKMLEQATKYPKETRPASVATPAGKIEK